MITDSFFNSITEIADSNPFSTLDSYSDTEHADLNSSVRLDLIPVDASTPQKTHPRSKNKPLKCVSLNCNSLKSTGKVAELQNIIDNLNPDIIFACETKLDQSHASYSIFPKNYTVLRKDRNQNGGGVLIAVKDDIVFSEPTFLADIDGEAKWVCLEFANSKPMYLCSYYIPETSDGSTCLEQLKEALCRIHTKHKRSPPLIHIAGDLNLGDIDWDSMKPTCARTASHHNKLIELLDEFGMQNMQTEPSRPASGKCLDLVITNMPVSVSNTATAPGMSDHDLVTFELNAKPKRIAKPPHKIYQYAKSNVEQLKEELTKITTEFFQNNPASKSTNANWNYFRTKVLAAIDKHIPNKMSNAKHNLPWITRSIKRQMRKRDRLYKRAKKTKKPSDWRHYTEFRNRLAKTIRSEYNTYVNEVVGGSLTENPKQFWNHVRLTNTENLGIPTLVENEQLHVTDKAKASALNSHFKAQFTQERGDIPPLQTSDFPAISPLTVGLEGVIKQLKAVNPNKASGPDELPSRIYHDYAEELAPMLQFIFQQSYDEGTIPDDWKKATVSAVHKKGSTSSPANYRPISLTCIACKIMEHIVLSHMNKHLARQNIISNKQHGFRASFSCATQLIESIHDWALSLNEKRNNRVCQVDTILLDFSKAFDRVAHRRLLAKLESYGIRGQLHQWIESFLSGRTQTVSVNGVHSDPINVTSGVPQGSVLGPSLFLLFINDIGDNISSEIRLFADDSILYRPIWEESDHDILQQDLLTLQKWATDWQMDFNVSKCKVLTISLKKKPVHFAYAMGDAFLEHVSNHPYLGVTISSNLQWTDHCQDICNKATRTLNTVRRTLHPCSKEVKERAYQALVRPKLEYAPVAWNPSTKTDIARVEQVQRNAARFVGKVYERKAEITKLVQDLGWQTLESRRRQIAVTTLHKIVQHLVGISLPTYITTAPNDPTKFIQPQTRVNIYSFSFYPRTIRIWNRLPMEIRSIEDPVIFARQAFPVVAAMQPPPQLSCL